MVEKMIFLILCHRGSCLKRAKSLPDMFVTLFEPQLISVFFSRNFTGEFFRILIVSYFFLRNYDLKILFPEVDSRKISALEFWLMSIRPPI